MYTVGEYIIVKNKGVFQIVSQEGNIYQAKMYGNDISEIIQSEEIVRPICSREMIEEVLDRIEFTRTIQAPSIPLRKELGEDAFNEYDELEWVKIIKTYYVQHKMNRAQPFEKTNALKAEIYLYSEISILLEIPYEKVETYITDYIHNSETLFA